MHIQAHRESRLTTDELFDAFFSLHSDKKLYEKENSGPWLVKLDSGLCHWIRYG
jgi:hypothetical protein